MASLKKSLVELKHASSSLGTNLSNSDVNGAVTSKVASPDGSFRTIGLPARVAEASFGPSSQQAQVMPTDHSVPRPPGQTTPTKRAGETLLSNRLGIDMNKIYRQTQDLAFSATRQSTSAVNNVNNAQTDSSVSIVNTSQDGNRGGSDQSNFQNIGGRSMKPCDMGYADARSFLDNFHIHYMENVLSQNRIRIQSATDELVQTRLAADWEKIKMEQYGISSRKDGPNSKVVNGVRFIHDAVKGIDSKEGRIVRPAFVQKKPRAITPTQDDMVRAGYPSDMTAIVPTDSSNNIELHWFGMEHLHILNNLDLSMLSQLAQRICKEFQQTQNQQSLDEEKLDLHSLVSYHNATKLLHSMFQFENMTGLPKSNDDASKVYGRSVGVMQFLAKQFRKFIETSVKNNSASRGVSNSTSQMEGLSGDILSFVESQVGRDVMERGGIDVAWRCLYYCLRCGDAIAASDCVSSFKNIDSSVTQTLVIMAEKQGRNNTSIFDAIDLIQSMRDALPFHLHQSLQTVYQRAQTRESEVDKYELACLALLSLSDSTACTDVTSSTIEDFIFAKIWNCVHSLGQSPLDSCEDQIALLGENIKHWGPSYFEDETSGGWSFALPLLLCQQFKTAFIHLANSGSGVALCQCTHLALAMSLNGVSSVDWESNDNGQKDIIENLLIAYASSLEHVAPDASLRYLIHLPAPQQAVSTTGIYKKDGKELGLTALNKICRLIIDTRAYEVLGGEVTSDGSRNGNGSLIKYFSHASTSDILAHAAEQAIREGSIVDGAKLFSLAEKYGSLISLLTKELACRLVVHGEDEEENEKRKFWYEAATNFSSLYLSDGRSHVLMVLEQEGTKMSLGIPFQQILNLTAFVDRCADGNWQGALELVDGMELIPKRNNDTSRAVDSFHSLSRNIREVFHHIVTLVMECICKQYSAMKAIMRGDHMLSNGEATSHKMKELRERAKCLVAYAGLLPSTTSSDSMKSTITRMEAFMV